DDRQRGAVDRDRALLDDVPGELGGQREAHDLPVLARRAVDHDSRAVDVTLDDVAAQASRGGHGALEVDPVPRLQVAQTRAVERLAHDVGAEGVAPGIDDGEAAAVHGDGVAVTRVGGDQWTAD